MEHRALALFVSVTVGYGLIAGCSSDDKEDTGAGDGRPERQPAFGAKMKSDPIQRYGPTDGTTIHPANIAKLNQSRDL